MEDKKTVFNYISQLFAIYGVVVAIFVAISLIIGNEAGSVSTLFSLGSTGLSARTLIELFILVVIVTIDDNLFHTDLIIKNMPLIVRNILFFAVIMVTTTVFAAVFGWFPLNDIGSWIGFIVSFSVCAVFSSFLMRLEEKAENKKMQEALKNITKREAD